MMKFCVTLSLIVAYISLASCRPQSVQVEKQRLFHLENQETPREQPKEKRGSAEETKRILQEINKINIALGYIPRQGYGFPRNVGNEGYFYPRQQFQTRPEFFTKPKKNQQNINRSFKSQRAINPFSEQNYYYPAPYLHVPINGKPLKFKNIKNSDFMYPVIYSPLNVVPLKNSKDLKDDSIKLGTIVVMTPQHDENRSPKSVETKSEKKINGTKVTKKPVYEATESSLIEEFVNYVPAALGLTDLDDDDSEEERIETKPPVPLLPAIKNDKFLNFAKKHPHESEGEQNYRNQLPPLPPANRAFNFSNSIERIQNLTKQFSFKREEGQKKSDELTTISTPTSEDIEEETEEKADDKEDEKSPFGFVFGPKQQLQTFKEGGLIIQRLRVRHGGIAIAGPGGVATAGSGGTAIVGPNGIAFTHPRGLAIGGPGAKIYAVPESTDLEKLALTHKARKLDDEGVLVARGPAIFYNKESLMQQRDPRAAQFADVNLVAPSFYSNEFYGTYPSYKNAEFQQNNPPTNARKRQLRKLTNMDIKYVQAVQQPDTKFNVKEFAYVPENKDQASAETMPLAKIVRPSTKTVKDSIKSQKLQIFADNRDDNDLEERVKVESIGMSSADQPLPDYSPFFPDSLFPLKEVRSDESTLILEPNSKAVSGNKGISISTPLSRALLRRGTAVKLLFRPQSVAISGAGGTSHAQADLIVDFIDE